LTSSSKVHAVKLREKTTLFDEFETTINGVCFSIGIPEALSRFEQGIVFNFIQGQFGGLTLENIVEAFTLYSANKLDFKTSHFGKFDNKFIGDVLHSYSVEVAKKQTRTKVNPEPVKRIKYSPEVGEESFEFIKSVFEKDKKPPFIASWTFAFNWMWSQKIIVLEDFEIEAIKNTVKNDAKVQMKQRRLQGKDTSKLMSMIQNGDGLKFECHKKCVIDYFTEMISN